VRAKLVNVEDIHTNSPVKQIVLKPVGLVEQKLIRRLRASGIRNVRLVFTEQLNEVRVVVPNDLEVI
jgi:hypothetical protein